MLLSCLSRSTLQWFLGQNNSHLESSSIIISSFPLIFKTKECIHILKGHTDTISCIAVDTTGIYTSSFDRTIRIWDDQTFLCRQTWTGHTTRVLSFLRHQDLIYSTSLDKIIKVWNIHVLFTLKTHFSH